MKWRVQPVVYRIDILGGGTMPELAMAAARDSIASRRRWEMRETGEPIEMEGPYGKFRIATAAGQARVGERISLRG